MARPFNPLGKQLAAYNGQRHQAAKRGIGWEFTFETWWALWLASGKWERRGLGRGKYCMARTGDVGPYAPTNVRICLNAENAKESYQTRPYIERAGRIGGATGIGGGKGVYFRTDRPRAKPYTSTFRGKHLGSFATEGEASAAYRAASLAYLESIGQAVGARTRPEVERARDAATGEQRALLDWVLGHV